MKKPKRRHKKRRRSKNRRQVMKKVQSATTTRPEQKKIDIKSICITIVLAIAPSIMQLGMELLLR